jgi:hypothetical protein
VSHSIDISLPDRLLKVCYVPTTKTGLPKAFFAAAINSTNDTNKADGMCH